MKTETKPAPEGVSFWIHFFRILAMHRTGYSAKYSEIAIMTAPDYLTNALAQSLFMVPLPEGHHMKSSALAAEWIKDSTV